MQTYTIRVHDTGGRFLHLTYTTTTFLDSGKAVPEVTLNKFVTRGELETWLIEVLEVVLNALPLDPKPAQEQLH